ncbi:MAG: saccharopine dehydrogenase [Kordiimonadaceae bacterium]|jgi:saccharopine dehydrogenase (NAD+, L-lysine forming)|nr:saccharopine dehydrogenase [Kordiimonadaceae bacterium]MBT6033177.1 saccharopine dehydrogenase [Kordiimonadaceae bacterium]
MKNNNSTIKTIWLRSESRPTERRTPLLADGAKALLDHGYNVVVERSENRIIDNNEYADVGCEMVDAGGWMNPPEDAVILGLKELPDEPAVIKNPHILFAHAYKEQTGWKEMLSRFKTGGADLLDIEYMTRENGVRYVAFGYRAGYMGAALSLLQWFSTRSGEKSYLDAPLMPFDNADLLDDTIAKLALNVKKPKVLIIGAGGRCGAGAADIFERHGAEITRWDWEETVNIDREALADHDIMINCAFIKSKGSAFIRPEDIKEGIRLSIVTDVSCDPFSDFNPVPIYDAPTSWDKAYIPVYGTGDKSINLIAIDNLPSLLPRESSEEFAGLMLPHLLVLNNRENEQPWQSAKKCFDEAVTSMDNK